MFTTHIGRRSRIIATFPGNGWIWGLSLKALRDTSTAMLDRCKDDRQDLSYEEEDLVCPVTVRVHNPISGGVPDPKIAAEGITGNCALELAAERRRSSYSLLLLSPAIGQRAGELCEGEIGRQCRHDPG